MSDWTEGYVAEIDYTYGYYSELNPLRIAMPLLNVGLAPPPVATACELGFGQGISVNIHAAASGVHWYGTDFNPSHAGLAQSLAALTGSDARLFDEPFAEFCARSDLPDFDFIALHGVWSWISDDNRRAIVDLARRKLKLGGVFYVSYNTQPGFAATVPLRHLMMRQAETMVASGQGIAARIDGALEFAEQLLTLNPAFAVANPTMAERLRLMKGQSRNYLAHEFFNRDWHPMMFAEMAQTLAPAKLSYACSTHFLDHVEAVNLSVEQQQFLGRLPDPVFRQSVRDFMINQQFRRDYWVKGPRRLSPLEQAEAVRRVRVMLLAGPRSDIGMTVAGALGQREMNAAVYGPILDALADYRPRTIGEVEATARASGIQFASLYEALMVLAGKGELAAAQDDAACEAAQPRTDRFNRWAFDRARSTGDIAYLASPVLGGGIAVARFFQLFLLARLEGRRSADELAQFAWDTISPQGQRMLKDGKPLESADENLAELAAEARGFLDKRLPLLQALRVA